MSLGLQQRLKLPGLEPRRSDIVVAGAVLFDTILRRIGATEITLCDLALREGLVLDYISRNREQIAQADRYPDVRRRSVIELAERCHYSPEHAQQIARLALSLFDQTRSVHGLGDRERDWLEYAAVMHDLGVHISYEKHHRHSYYLVKNGDLRGFDPQEIEVMALLTRYHRQAAPKKAHEGYGALPEAAAAHGARALRHPAARRGPRSEPLAAAVGGRTAGPRRGRIDPVAHGRRCGARIVGRAPARDPVRADARQTCPVRDPRNDIPC